MPDLKEIKDVEVFSVGVWNGDEYTEKDLDGMVQAFKEIREGEGKQRPHLKLGHDPEQTLIKQSELPAAGYMENVRRVGKKIIADFTEIPSQIFTLLEKGAFKKPSLEVFWNAKINNKLYRRVIAACSFLGAEWPGVHNLDDILALYGLTDYHSIKSYDESFETKIYNWESDMPKEQEKTVKKDEKNLALEAAELKHKEYKLSAEKELEELKQFKLDAEKEKEKLIEEKIQAENDTFIAELDPSPAMKPFVQALLEDKKEYEIKEKKYTKKEIIKELFALKDASDVNLEESSEKTKIKENELDTKDEEITKYAAEHKCSYGDAYRIVMSGVKAEYEDEDETEDED